MAQRITGLLNAVLALGNNVFGAPTVGFVDKNKPLGIEGTTLTAAWHTAMQEETCQLVERFGSVLDANNDHQMYDVLSMRFAAEATLRGNGDSAELAARVAGDASLQAQVNAVQWGQRNLYAFDGSRPSSFAAPVTGTYRVICVGGGGGGGAGGGGVGAGGNSGQYSDGFYNLVAGVTIACQQGAAGVGGAVGQPGGAGGGTLVTYNGTGFAVANGGQGGGVGAVGAGSYGDNIAGAFNNGGGPRPASAQVFVQSQPGGTGFAFSSIVPGSSQDNARFLLISGAGASCAYGQGGPAVYSASLSHNGVDGDLSGRSGTGFGSGGSGGCSGGTNSVGGYGAPGLAIVLW